MMPPLPALNCLVIAALAVACAPDARSPQATQRKMYGLLEKFDRYDDNGDGYLTRKELVDGVQSAGTMTLTDEDLERAFKGYDTNRDGRISFREAQRGAAAGPQIFPEPKD